MGMLNCWNFKNCGRYPGGPKAAEMGVCPVASMPEADGFLGGRGAGRACAYVSGTFCGGVVQGSYKDKKKNCEKCDYYQALKKAFGVQVSVMSFNKYVRGAGGRSKTPPGQPWIDPKVPGDVVAKRAQGHYGN